MDNVQSMEFVDNADCIAAISEFVGKDIAVDYSDNNNPILKIGDIEIKEHEWIAKSEDGTISKL